MQNIRMHWTPAASATVASAIVCAVSFAMGVVWGGAECGASVGA
jgi:hypothetical protein